MHKKIICYLLVILLLPSFCGCALLGTALSAGIGYGIYQATHKQSEKSSWGGLRRHTDNFISAVFENFLGDQFHGKEDQERNNNHVVKLANEGNEIWNIPNVKSNHPEKTIHPCQFPVELVERCVLALTNENDWVLDPYAGVGSALIAAIKNNRKAAGCDKEEVYVEVAKKRIADYFLGELKLRPVGKPVFTPTGKEKVSQIPEEWRKEIEENANTGNLFV